MHRWLPGLVWAAAVFAQQPEKQELNRMLDEIRASIRSDDWVEASRTAARLNAALLTRRTQSQPTPTIELQHLWHANQR